MARKPFTVRTNTTNQGGIYSPFTFNRWKILLMENGDIVDFVVTIPSTSCPKEWLETIGYTLEVDALAQILR